MNIRLYTKENLIVWPLIIIGILSTSIAAVNGNKIIFVPMVFLGLLGWVRFATKYPAEALIIIIFFAEDCFDIFTFGIRQRLLSDIGIALMLTLIALRLPRVWNHIARTALARSSYAIAILLFFCTILISLYFGSYSTFGQPLTTSLTVARKYLLFGSYFFLVAVRANREDCFKFLKYLAWLGATIAFLSIIEVALGGGVIFSHYYAIGQERAGHLRIHVGTFLIVFSVVYSFIKFQHLSKLSSQRLNYILLLGLDLYTLAFITLTRAVILGLSITFFVWLIRKISIQKIMFFCAIVSVVLVIILSGMENTILSGTFVGRIIEKTVTELGGDQGNIAIRKKGALYYLGLLQEAPLSGIGLFSSTNYPDNPVTEAAELDHYYIVDINSICTLIFFGPMGLLLLIFFILKSLRDSILVIRYCESTEKYNFEVLFFIFVYTLATPTLNNLVVERMLLYSGVFFYLLSLSNSQIRFSRANKKRVQ